MHTAGRHLLSPGPRAARRPARGEEGAAAVEAAIVLPLILLLIFGIIDFGRALQQQTLLSTAVREGARAAALNATTAEVRTRVQNIAGTDATVTSTTLCTNSSVTNAEAKVIAEQTFTPLTPLFTFMQMYSSTNYSFSTIRATGIMLCTG